MKRESENTVRSQYISLLKQFLAEHGEDIDLVTSNTLNFPVTVGEEEGWVEIVVKATRYTDDEGYEKRADFRNTQAEKTAKAEKAKADRKAKAEQDKAARESRKAKKAE